MKKLTQSLTRLRQKRPLKRNVRDTRTLVSTGRHNFGSKRLRAIVFGAKNQSVRPLTDLHDSIRQYCHQKSRFGMANRATCYFEAFKRIEETPGPACSSRPRGTPSIYAERKPTLRYRYGTMWTRKMASRCGHAPSSKSLLCGDEDGGHHTASGCPALKRMYIDQRAQHRWPTDMTRMLKGRNGAFVIQMDLGSTDNCAEEWIMA